MSTLNFAWILATVLVVMCVLLWKARHELWAKYDAQGKSYEALEKKYNILKKNLREAEEARDSHMQNSLILLASLEARSAGARAVEDTSHDLVNQVDRLQQRIAELEAESREDPLTGLLNRRGLAERLPIVLGLLARGVPTRNRAIADRRRAPKVSAIMFDIDHFKGINDRYGHTVGDQVLEEVARRIREAGKGVRSQDIMARLGGEEFWVILPGIDLENARIVAEGIRKAVSYYDFMVQIGDTLEAIKVTISAGVASVEVVPMMEHGTVYERLYNESDAALYHAKRPDDPRMGNHPGRDRVVCYQSPTQ